MPPRPLLLLLVCRSEEIPRPMLLQVYSGSPLIRKAISVIPTSVSENISRLRTTYVSLAVDAVVVGGCRGCVEVAAADRSSSLKTDGGLN